MKILHVIKHCAHANGNVNAAVDLACAQAKAGLDVTFASAGGVLEPLLVQHGVKIVRTVHTERSPAQAIKTGLVLLMAALRLRPQIIHAHMVSSNLLSQVPRRLCGAKLITTVHNAFEPSAWMMGWADRVITVSAANATDLIKRKVPEKRIRVVWNGPINSPRLPTTFEDVILPKPTIVTVCGLHHRKRVEDILEAAAMVLKSVPSASFYLVGEGPDLEKLENMTQTLGISASVHFMGYQANPLPWMKAADIFVLASRAEPFGLVLAEARSQGCAIVATNVDGIPEVLEHGKAGILVPPLSPIDLAREITLLLQNDDRLREFRSRAKAGCDWLTVERMEQNVRDVYFDALGRPNAAAATAARL